ncbi:MAG: hypothetical protein M1308_12690 [Actinobacteria bacterium]|nr:hypothetical protein [Actinomycetota bacterium]
MDLIRLLSAIISLFFIGYVPVYFMLLKNNSSSLKFRSIPGRVFIFFISFYTGMLVASIYLAVLSLAGLKYSLASTSMFSAVFFIASIYLFVRKKLQFSKSKSGEGHDIKTECGNAKGYEIKEKENSCKRIIFYIFVFLIFINFLTVLFFALLFPIRFWDAIASWSLKGRAFFIDASIVPFFKSHNYQFAHLSYPLYLPLMQTWIYVWMGKINENLVKVIFPLFYLSGLFILYYLFSKKYKRAIAIIYVFIFSALPVVMDHGYIEYTNLLFAIILMLAVCFFYNYIKGEASRIHLSVPQDVSAAAIGPETKNYLMLSTIFFGILAQIRSEGLFFLGIFLIINLILDIAFIIRDKKAYKSFKTGAGKATAPSTGKFKKINYYSGPILAILTPVFFSLLLMAVWIILKHKLNIRFLSNEWLPVLNGGQQNNIFGQGIFSFGQALKALFSELIFSAFDSTRAYLGSSYGVIWGVLFIFFIFNVKKLFKNFNWIFFAFIAAGFIVLLLSLGAIADFTWSTDRYVLHLFPLTYFWILYNLPA